jgi:hypothetical protein
LVEISNKYFARQGLQPRRTLRHTELPSSRKPPEMIWQCIHIPNHPASIVCRDKFDAADPGNNNPAQAHGAGLKRHKQHVAAQVTDLRMRGLEAIQDYCFRMTAASEARPKDLVVPANDRFSPRVQEDTPHPIISVG